MTKTLTTEELPDLQAEALARLLLLRTRIRERDAADSLVRLAAIGLLSNGASYAFVGKELGITRQAAHQRFSKVVSLNRKSRATA